MLGRGKREQPREEVLERVGPVTVQQPVSETSGLESQQLPRPAHPLGEREAPAPRSVVYVVQRTVREFNDDGGTDLAAALTYYSVLAIFPGLIALLSLVGVFGQADRSVDKIMEVLAPFITDLGTTMRVRDAITGLASTSGIGVGVAVGLLGALWSASGYVGAFSRAMNKIYEVDEGRPFWRMRARCSWSSPSSRWCCVLWRW